jgi:hypothetical protein
MWEGADLARSRRTANLTCCALLFPLAVPLAGAVFFPTLAAGLQ